MDSESLKTHQGVLAACRFCPMCKPAAEVANLTLIESYSTRARAMMLWRILSGLGSWGPREVELLYQSTLDSISQAWCISHYPVSSYVLAARAEVFERDLAPRPVLHALERTAAPPAEIRPAARFLLLSEMDAAPDFNAGCPVVAMPSGALAWSLGARTLARRQIAAAVDFIGACGAREVVADSAATLWALRRLFPALAEVRFLSLAESLAPADPPGYAGARVWFHDCRAASHLAECMPGPAAIQPGFHEPESALGQGEVFDAPRRLLTRMGMELRHTVWTRALAKSCGADDGLWLTYPALAEGLARQRFEEARRLGVDLIVTESPACARHLARYSEIPVRWLAELYAPISVLDSPPAAERSGRD